MSFHGNTSRRVRTEDLQVEASAPEGWSSGTEQSIRVGAQVFCVGGMAQVVKILGKTSNGSRLLELRLADGTRQPFFVAATNVRVPPEVTGTV